MYDRANRSSKPITRIIRANSDAKQYIQDGSAVIDGSGQPVEKTVGVGGAGAPEDSGRAERGTIRRELDQAIGGSIDAALGWQ